MSERELGSNVPSSTSQAGSAEAILLERLGEAGCLACECGLLEEAEQIYSCLVKLKPSSAGAHIGLAIVQSMKGMASVAAENMRKVVAEFPENDMAKAVLGLVLAELRQPEAEELFKQVLANGKNQDAMHIARLCMPDAPKEQAKETKQEAAPVANASESLEVFRHRNIRP